MYDYEMEIQSDCYNAIIEQLEQAQETLTEQGRDALQEQLYDDLWIDDSVTGNGSGSYTFNAWQAHQNIFGNDDLIERVVSEFGLNAETVAEHLTDWEYWDCSIRCLLLGQGIDAAIDELIDDGKLVEQ